MLVTALVAACGGGGSSGGASGPAPLPTPNPPPPVIVGPIVPADPPPIDFARFGLREPAAATLAAFESGGQLAQLAVDTLTRGASVTRFPASVSCAPGATDTTTDAIDLDFTDADQNGRFGPGDLLRATFRDCRSTAFAGARLTGTMTVAPQVPPPFSGPDAPDERGAALLNATALVARWAADDAVTLDGTIAAQQLIGRPFRATVWTTSASPLRVVGRRTPFAFDLALRNSRGSQYHDYREARTTLVFDGEVVEYASAGGWRLTAESVPISFRLNQYPQAGRVVLRGAGTQRAALTAVVGELALESDRDGDGLYESRNMGLESWTLGSKGWLFWDPFTARPSPDAYALGTNPNDALERLVSQPDLSTGAPVLGKRPV
jgi:hypothetical protein